MRNEILEFPFSGTITRKVTAKYASYDDPAPSIIYDGEMDIHTTTPEEGRVAQTSDHIVSIPLKKDVNGKYIIPRKGDFICVVRYGEEFEMVIDNVEPSQLGGISIYASRKAWDGDNEDET